MLTRRSRRGSHFAELMVASLRHAHRAKGVALEKRFSRKCGGFAMMLVGDIRVPD
jgi:hypothetical protein